jgi:DtxR family Mn-dependent transcriptional regulator
MTDERSSRTCCGLTPTPAVEDALRTVYVLSGRAEPVTTSALARELGVTAPTVSAMVRRLDEHGLVERGGEQRVTLTPHGAGHARHVVRRHRVVETFLVRVLGMPWDAVHAEADRLEHAVSDALLERLDAFLGRPERDPHGDPVPRDGDGRDEDWGVRLDTAPPACHFVVERVYDRDPAALRHLADLGIRPGAGLDVVAQAPFGGPLWVRLDGRDHALGDTLVRLVHGRVAP